MKTECQLGTKILTFLLAALLATGGIGCGELTSGIAPPTIFGIATTSHPFASPMPTRSWRCKTWDRGGG